MIRFSCAHCGQGISAEPEATGRKMKCPSCWEMTPVPDLDQSVTFDSLPTEPDKSGKAVIVIAAMLLTVLFVAALFIVLIK
jgi:hypothetical protein